NRVVSIGRAWHANKLREFIFRVLQISCRSNRSYGHEVDSRHFQLSHWAVMDVRRTTPLSKSTSVAMRTPDGIRLNTTSGGEETSTLRKSEANASKPDQSRYLISQSHARTASAFAGQPVKNAATSV